MTGPDFRAIRLHFGFGVVEWGRVLGYTGNPDTVSRVIRRYEDVRVIPVYIERLAKMYRQHGIPDEFVPADLEKRKAFGNN